MLSLSKDCKIDITRKLINILTLIDKIQSQAVRSQRLQTLNTVTRLSLQKWAVQAACYSISKHHSLKRDTESIVTCRKSVQEMLFPAKRLKRMVSQYCINLDN